MGAGRDATRNLKKVRKGNWYRGRTTVLLHSIRFRYNLHDHELTDDLRKCLHREARSRARHCIKEGYHSGELNCLYVFPDPIWATSGLDVQEEEIRGWWEIK